MSMSVVRRKEWVDTTCLECGVVTRRSPCFADRKFCDRRCATRHNNRLKRKRVIQSCGQCGDDFESLTCQQQKFCSKSCADQGRRVLTPLVCEWCGKGYERHPSRATQSKYCSHVCKEQAGAERRASREMTEDEYHRRLAAQGGVCAICSNPEVQRHHTGKVIKLTRDHDHASGVWRGLLCRRCNMALGMFDDDPVRLLRAADYVLSGGVPLVDTSG